MNDEGRDIGFCFTYHHCVVGLGHRRKGKKKKKN